MNGCVRRVKGARREPDNERERAGVGETDCGCEVGRANWLLPYLSRPEEAGQEKSRVQRAFMAGVLERHPNFAWDYVLRTGILKGIDQRRA